MSFLTPIAFAGALLAIPIILLYMLRLRRREVLVSSTFLWQQILRDSEANTPWQRLRRNLLLLLQLIILACIVFALARPFIVVPAVTTGQIELLLDASASMNATDLQGGGSRFEEAKRQALSIVDTMGINDTMTIIRVTDVPEVIQAATGDASALRAAINAAQPGQAQADWVGALTLASADAVDSSNFNTVIISDGGLGDASGLQGVPGNVQYIPVGQSSDNLAISALATRALPGQPPQLFAQITNYGQQDADVVFDLRVDGNLFQAHNYTVPAGSDLPIVTENLPQNFSVLQAGLTVPANSKVSDNLAEDNTAWAVSTDSGVHRALVMTNGNRFLDQVLTSIPGIKAFKGDITRPMPTDKYDLYIFDGWLPPDNTLPNGDLLIINPPQNTSFFTVGADTDQTGHIEVTKNDPRTNFVDFKDVNILKFKTVTGTDWADTLIKADGGPLLLAGQQNGRQVAILTFDLHNSDLPLQITWPILMANLLDWFTPRAAISVPGGLQVGQSLSIQAPLDATNIRFTLPDGSTSDLPVNRPTLAFAGTTMPGIYSADIQDGSGKTLQSSQFAVNLFSPTESNIAPRSSLSLSGNTITPATHEEVGQREFWPWAALLALIVLLIEWFVYQRRLQVRTVFRPTLRRREAG